MYDKKKICLVLIVLILFLVLISCSKKHQTVVIRYAAWNLGEVSKNGLERQMIQAFMKEYPDTKVEIDESFVKNYNSAIELAGEKNSFPDVFMYAGNPQAYTNGWCMDLTEVVTKDKEWQNVPAALQESAKVKGKIVAIPTAMYFYGYFCNNNIFESSKQKQLKVGLSVGDFVKAIKQTTDINNGRIGLADESNICDWYPAAVNNQFGWYSWDGGKFNLNSKAFKAGIKLARYIDYNKLSYALLNEQEKGKLHGTNDWEAWNAGTVALKFDGTWAMNDYAKLPFDVSFAGIPGGRTCIVPDYMFISKNTRYYKEAYELIKFMSAYSLKGFSKRMELAGDNKFVVSTMPMIKDKSILDKYFSNIKIDGIREVFNRINNNSYVEGTKVLPGYKMARWDYKTNIAIGKTKNASIGEVITNAYRGNLKIDDVASQLNDLANTCIQIYPQQLSN